MSSNAIGAAVDYLLSIPVRIKDWLFSLSYRIYVYCASLPSEAKIAGVGIMIVLVLAILYWFWKEGRHILSTDRIYR